MKKFALSIILFFPIICLSAWADIWGNRDDQELSDVVYRDIKPPLNIHPAIYGGRLANRLPGTIFDDEVVEMTGVLTTKLCLKGLCADSVASVTALPLSTFEKKGKFYYGAFKGKDRVTGNDLSLSQRQEIRRITYRDFLTSQNPIPYVVQPNEGMGYLLTRYIQYTDKDLDGKIEIDQGEIDRMRSDAFVEYCYAAAKAPITRDEGVVFDITTTAGAEKLNNWHLSLIPVTPETQRASMTPATIKNPRIAVYKDKTNEQVFENQLVKGERFNIFVKDSESGPSNLELYLTEYLGKIDTRRILGPPIETVSEDYTFEASKIGELTPGLGSVTAYDHAGNSSGFNFKIGGKGRIEIYSTYPMYYNFLGGSSVVQSTMEHDHLFIFHDAIANLSSANVTGPQGNLWSQTFDPPVVSTTVEINNMPAGDYTASLINSVGSETTAKFNIV